jgi:hypothetical protein
MGGRWGCRSISFNFYPHSSVKKNFFSLSADDEREGGGGFKSGKAKAIKSLKPKVLLPFCHACDDKVCFNI